jgi:hypothetical protein
MTIWVSIGLAYLIALPIALGLGLSIGRAAKRADRAMGVRDE